MLTVMGVAGRGGGRVRPPPRLTPVQWRGIRRVRGCERSVALPAASELATRMRVAKLPCLARPAVAGARRIDAVIVCPEDSTTVLVPRTTTLLARPVSTGLAVLRVSAA